MIKELSQTVINQIAAGEIVVGPQNALKELIENSIDAGATRIEVVVKDGGVKLLQVTDNGCGISEADLGLLCKRWCTSKIDSHVDLLKLTSFGFRGEALASISHVSHVTVTTKTKDAPAATRAKYVMGELAETKLIAGNSGTQIQAQDLFFNNVSRLRALNKSDCHSKCVEVASKYGIHYDIDMSMRRQNDSSALFTLRGSKRDRIKVMYGSLANDLIDLKTSMDGSDDPEDSPAAAFGLRAVSGLVTNPNSSSGSKNTFIFFINNRLVSCEPIRRAFSNIYTRFLPTKGHPFVYLSLDIDPANLDVNVHPTKQEVRFLHESDIVEHLSGLLTATLSSADSSRSYKVVNARLDKSSYSNPSSSQQPNTYAHSQNRTDYSQTHLPFKKVRLGDFAHDPEASESVGDLTSDLVDDSVNDSANESFNDSQAGDLLDDSSYTPTRLKSIHTLYQEQLNNASPSLAGMFKYHVFVGVVDPLKRICCIQNNLELLLVDYGRVTCEFFYQLALEGFSNYGTVTLDPPVNMDLDPEHVQILENNAPMLSEYFGITFEDGHLRTLPMLLRNYTFSASKVTMFASRLAKSCFSEEKTCFSDICHALALLYTAPIDDSDCVIGLFQRMRDVYVPTKDVEPSIIRITSMPNLYKVFERC